MYIANTTKQNWHLNVWVPEARRHQTIPVASGRQVFIGKDWNSTQNDSVVLQLERFGARPARDANGKLEYFPGILYSHDKPIPVDKIEMGHEAVVESQEKRAGAELTKGALGFDAALRDKRTRKRLARTSSLEVTQDVPKGTKPDGKEVVFGVTVANDGTDRLNLS